MIPLETFLKNTVQVKVISAAVKYEDYFPLDLSINNPALNHTLLRDSVSFENYIKNYLTLNNSKVAYGGYNEERNLYKRSVTFNDEETEERNIHIGLDLWTKEGTKVLAALDGMIHSYALNDGLGNYGPTIILKHQLENQMFYTLYGHLSVESIERIKIGDFFKKGQQLATLGDASVNGDYAPHLHFQIIKNIENYFGDYPGVCRKSDLDNYLKNCPDPNLLLKIVNINLKKP